MTKIILNDGSEEFLSPGAAREKVSSGEAKFPDDPHSGYGSTYNTRQLVAEPIKTRRKRKPKKAVIVEPEEEKVEPEQVDTDEVE